MNRRAVLVAIAGSMGLSGCLSGGSESPGGSPNDDPSTDDPSTDDPSTDDPSTAPPTSLSTGSGSASQARITTDDVEATFQVTDSHAPTDDTASATFAGTEVTVTGTMDPSGCNRPVLTDVQYDTTDDVVHLSVGGESRFGETATVECDNASYDYRCTLTVDGGQPEAVELVYAYDGKDDRSFELVRDG